MTPEHTYLLLSIWNKYELRNLRWNNIAIKYASASAVNISKKIHEQRKRDYLAVMTHLSALVSCRTLPVWSHCRGGRPWCILLRSSSNEIKHWACTQYVVIFNIKYREHWSNMARFLFTCLYVRSVTRYGDHEKGLVAYGERFWYDNSIAWMI